MPVDHQRLSRSFTQLCETDSPSRQEGKMCQLLSKIFHAFPGAKVWEDDTAATTGADCGNLHVRIPGRSDRDPLLFCCHMDTVDPAIGVKVGFSEGVFYSLSNTVLGADDKAGIAALIEAIELTYESGLPHCPIELVFTTCEEIGLLGVKAMDPRQLKAKTGYALDTTGIGRVIIASPTSNRLYIRIKGVAAHAGLNPEQGVNAIMLAARALSELRVGKLDDENSVNFGVINGGLAGNIVAEQVEVVGEVRSHSEAGLNQLTEEIKAAFKRSVDNWSDPTGLAAGHPKLEFETRFDYPLIKLSAEEPVIRQLAHAAQQAGQTLRYEKAGGGSDANILNGYGIRTAIVGTGMSQVHTCDEQVKLNDMVRLSKLIYTLLRA